MLVAGVVHNHNHVSPMLPQLLRLDGDEVSVYDTRMSPSGEIVGFLTVSARGRCRLRDGKGVTLLDFKADEVEEFRGKVIFLG